jgi:CHAT domain-containing protein
VVRRRRYAATSIASSPIFGRPDRAANSRRACRSFRIPSRAEIDRARDRRAGQRCPSQQGRYRNLVKRAPLSDYRIVYFATHALSEAARRLTATTFEILKSDPRLGRAEALRQAMLNYLNDQSSPQNAYPAFWGPFAIIGKGAAR